MRSSFEDAGALIDHLSPQTDVLVLDLLGCAVHGLGNQATLRYLTLQRKSTRVHWVSKGKLDVGGVMF